MTEIKTCKKFHRNLPSNYKYNRCESCRNKIVGFAKKVGKPIVGTLAIAVPFVLKNILDEKTKK